MNKRSILNPSFVHLCGKPSNKIPVKIRIKPVKDPDHIIESLLNQKEEKIESDFIITENYHTRLGENVAKMLIEKINSNVKARYNYKNGKNYPYQIILQDNLQQLSNFILEKKNEFDFVIPKM